MNPKNNASSDQQKAKIVKELAVSLRNVGPKLAERLVNVGIKSSKELVDLGAQAAFLKMYPKGDVYGDFNAAYLYALEGAIRDCDWLEIPDDTKTELKQFAQGLQKQNKK